MPTTEVHQLAYRRRDAAASLGISEDSLDRLIGRGELLAVRIGKSVRVSASELERFVRQLEAQAGGG